MTKYYPLTRIKTNLYTRGGEYRLPDGRTFTGRYYLTYDNKAFVGINPVVGDNTPLTRIPPVPLPLQNGPALPQEYFVGLTQNTQTNPSLSEIELTTLSSYYPVPIESDYARGYFTRYFAKTVSGPGSVIEISQIDFANLKNNTLPPGVLGYEFTSMIWQLTGPKNDVRVSQYQVKGGVEDTNKRVTEAKERDFRGIFAFIGGDYTKFAKITK
jgi:hypothetical protein